MRLLATQEERKIPMKLLRRVVKVEKIIFPLSVFGLWIFQLPSAWLLIGFFIFGNLNFSIPN